MPEKMRYTPKVLDAVYHERERQILLWGVQDHTPQIWLAILMEEVGEVAKEIAEGRIKDFDKDRYCKELTHTAAVAVAAVETIKRKNRFDG